MDREAKYEIFSGTPSGLTGMFMPSIFPSVAVAALFASTPVWAQSTPLAHRVVAPSAFLGVDLQGDFLTEVPECTATNQLPTELCRIATEESGRFEILGLPYLPISPGYKLFAELAEGVVSTWELIGNTSNLYLVKDLLTDKFGKPAATFTEMIRLQSGATYSTETFHWNTQGVAINFARDLSDLSRYSVTISTSPLGTDIGTTESTHNQHIPTL